MFWFSSQSKVQKGNVKLFAAICRIYWLLVAAENHQWGKSHSSVCKVPWILEKEMCSPRATGKGFGFSMLVPGGRDGLCYWVYYLCQAGAGTLSAEPFLASPVFPPSCAPTQPLWKDQELHWDLHWPKAEILPLFHMDQHNNAEFPLPYSFKSRVEKYRLQTGVRVAGWLSLF